MIISCYKIAIITMITALAWWGYYPVTVRAACIQAPSQRVYTRAKSHFTDEKTEVLTGPLPWVVHQPCLRELTTAPVTAQSLAPNHCVGCQPPWESLTVLLARTANPLLFCIPKAGPEEESQIWMTQLRDPRCSHWDSGLALQTP